MKNPYTVLSQKEEDVARVRKEIQALLTVIPLLTDQAQLLGSCPDFEHSIKDGMTALELYYPFVRNLQKHQQPNIQNPTQGGSESGKSETFSQIK